MSEPLNYDILVHNLNSVNDIDNLYISYKLYNIYLNIIR